MTDEDMFRVFCRCVAITYQVHQARGYPADRKYMRHFMAFRSALYYFRVSHRVERALMDPELKRQNEDYRDRWLRLLRVNLVGGAAEHVRRQIETLELQRLLIEFAFDRSAFGFSGAALDGERIEAS